MQIRNKLKYKGGKNQFQYILGPHWQQEIQMDHGQNHWLCKINMQEKDGCVHSLYMELQYGKVQWTLQSKFVH